MNVTGQMSARSNVDIAMLGVPTRESQETKNTRHAVELSNKKKVRMSNPPEEFDHMNQNSSMTLEMPKVDNELSLRQTMSKLIKIDENSPKVK